MTVREWFRRHERRLAAAWLVFTLLVILVVVVAPVRMRLLARAQVGVDWWDGRWERRLTVGQRLVDTGRFAEAAPYLARLDAVFPAPHARYGRDKEREVLLSLLARSYEALGHKTIAMSTWLRLVHFDSLNYRNHVAYARAAERLRGGWAEQPEARDGFAHALRLLPSHLPSLRGYSKYYLDRGEFLTVRSAYAAYLDAFLVEQFTITAGDASMTIPVLVDGNAHVLDIPFARPAGWHGDLVITSPSYPMSLEEVAVLPSVVVGVVGHRESRPVAATTIQPVRMTQSGAGWVPTDSSAALHVPIAADERGIARVQLRLRVFKLMDAKLWDGVRQSYRNLLDDPGLADATARTAPFATPEQADRAFDRIGWTRGGRYVPGER